jgi:hypothetical protein
MESHKLCVKLFLQEPAALHGVKLLPLFQYWIQMRAIEEHLAIDVADYEHVPEGPGTVLVTHEANFSLDSAQGRPGLLYQRKQALAGNLEDRVASVFRFVLSGAARLEENPGLKFRTDEILFRVADRLLAPNNPETFDEVRPALESFFGRLLGPSVRLEHTPSALTLFEVTIKSATSATVSDLLAKVEAVPTAS